MTIEPQLEDPFLARLYRDLDNASQRLKLKDEDIDAVDEDLAIAGDQYSKRKHVRRREILVAERTKIEAEISGIKRDLDSAKQSRILCALHYLYHPRHRDAFWEERVRKVSAFAIDGSPPGELWWSVHFSLKRLCRFQMQAAVRSVVLRPAQSQANDVLGLWEGLRLSYQPPPHSADPEVVASFVATELQRQHVVLVVDALPTPESPDSDLFIDLDGLFNDFWPALVSLVQPRQPPPSRYRLLLFVLYEQTPGWSFRVADQFDPVRQPELPRRLPVIPRLSEGDLEAWLKETDVIPDELNAILDQGVAGLLAATGNGVPDRVIAYLCEKTETKLDKGAHMWAVR